MPEEEQNGTTGSDELSSRSGDEHSAGRQPASESDRLGGSVDLGRRSVDHDDAVVDAEVVESGHSPGAASTGVAEGWSGDPFGDGDDRQPGPGQISLFQASVGPLPPVDQLAGYGELDPSFPERIMRMAEASTTDASAREDAALAAEISERKWGQRSAIILAFTGIFAAVIFAALGHYAFAGVLVSVPFVLLVRALVGDAGRRGASPDAPPPPPPGDAS